MLYLTNSHQKLPYFSSYQEYVGQYGVLEGGVSEGVYGGDGAGRDAVQPLQDVVPQLLQLYQVDNKRS